MVVAVSVCAPKLNQTDVSLNSDVVLSVRREVIIPGTAGTPAVDFACQLDFPFITQRRPRALVPTSFALMPHRRLISAAVLVLPVLLAGCEKREQVSTYTVASHESLQTPEYLALVAQRKAGPARMLAAIVPNGPALWFFKLQGPPELVADREPEFRELLKSIKFQADGSPKWTLPAKWKEQPGNEMRFATLVLPDSPLEVTVTTLPAGGDLTEAILANINRWRNQLELPFIDTDDLNARTETIKQGELTITLINIVGKVRPKAAMPGGMSPMAAPMSNRAPAVPESAQEEPAEIKFDKPKEWRDAPPKTFTLAVFEATEGNQKVTITLSRAGGSKVANVNRWRGQMGLKPMTDDEVMKSLEKTSVGPRTGELVTLEKDGQTMLGLMIPDGDQSVFVKLTGDAELAKKERARFDAFAKSLKF